MAELSADLVDHRCQVHLRMGVHPADHLHIRVRFCHHVLAVLFVTVVDGTRSRTADKTVMGAW